MEKTLDLPTIDTTEIDRAAKNALAQAAQPAAQQPLVAVAPAVPDLTKIDLTDVALAMYGTWRKDVDAVKANLSTLVLDLNTPAKITEARSLRARLIAQPLAEARKVAAGIKSKMAKTSKAVGAELELIETAYTEADALILPKIEAAEEEAKREREEKQRIERERIERHQANIARIRSYAEKAEQPDMTAERIAAGIAQLEAIPVPTKEAWEEFAVPAADAICWALERMRITHARVLRAEQAEAEAAELRAKLAAQAPAEPNSPQQGANRDASAEQSHVAEGSASPTGRGADGPTAGGAAPVSHTREGQASQQVLKAEPATADATDRDAPAVESPRVGAMGAGQAADAAPAGGHPGPITMVEPADVPHNFRRDTLHKPPTPLEDSTPAELRNEWLLFEHALAHVMPMVERRCAAVDVTRFKRSLDRMRAIIQVRGEVQA